MTYHLYWGDLHSHCSISYGHGTAEQALARARQQLDFCSITGHAFWPDMPTDRQRYGQVIDYHREGFARLARNWDRLLKLQAEATQEGSFIALPSYEWHSLRDGDHNVYAKGPDLPLIDAPDVQSLREAVRPIGGLVVPHHIGYAAGYRGIDWKSFREDPSPLVEVFSLHGCSVDEYAPYPMLHDMGPRDFASTAEMGWRLGLRFGIIGSTDHHGAYPGSHGDGRAGVFAERLTREALWEAFCARRVFAATGDKIDARLFIDDAWIGSVVRNAGRRRGLVQVRASDAIDRVELVKNGRIVARWYGDEQATAGPYRLRITWGWGRKDQRVSWQAGVWLSDGSIRLVETCFSGQSVAAPKGVAGHEVDADAEDLPHAIVEQSERHCVWRSVTSGNLTLRHATTQALSLELDAELDATVRIEANGQSWQHALAELLHAGRVHYLRGWLSEAIRIGPLVPQGCRTVLAEWTDEPERPVDVYRLQVAQRNGQWVWLSPIWVEQ